MTHSLTLGSLLLSDPLPDADHGYVFSVLADGASFGVAQSVQEVVQSLLTDGDLVRTTRHGNREVTFSVELTGPSLGALAEGEAALRRELGRPNTLVWQAPDIFAAPTAFEVIDSSMAQTFDDLAEMRTRRTFKVTLTCSPWACSTERTLITQPVSGTTTTSIDACNSATGWTGTRSGASWPVSDTWTAGSVTVVELDSVNTSPETWTMTRTGSVDFTTTPYLLVEMKTLSVREGLRVTVTANGTVLPVMENRRLPDGSGNHQLKFDATGLGVVSSLTFTHTSLPGEVWQGMFIRQLSRTNVLPGISSRQQSRIVNIGGTERTTASLQVKSPTSADLKHTIVASWPDAGSGFSPPMRPYRVTGNTVVPDAATISGSREAIGPTAVSFGVPAASIPPGAYQLVGRLRSVGATGSLNIYWEASTLVESVLLEGSVTGSMDASFPVVGRWEIVPLGTLSLPVITATAGDLYFGINHAGSSQVEYDELWLLPIGEDCAISAANVTATWLWCDAPAPGEANPQLRIGNTESRSNARSPGLATIGKGLHVLRPGQTTLFVASEVDGPILEGSYVKHWHSNAVD